MFVTETIVYSSAQFGLETEIAMRDDYQLTCVWERTQSDRVNG